MYFVIKRIFDLKVALVTIIILLPFFIPIMLVLKFTGEGEVFYFQERIGKNNENFKIFKFATMLKNSMNMGTGSITLENDFRVTKFGGFLRKTKLNELPQIFNIFKGDLSLVGPRPLVYQDFDAYPSQIRNKIYKIKPGLTGLGSIIFRDEESIISRNYDKKDPHKYYKNKIAPYKGSLEIYYQKEMSFFTDIKIIILTAWVIFFPESKIYKNWFRDLPKRNF